MDHINKFQRDDKAFGPENLWKEKYLLIILFTIYLGLDLRWKRGGRLLALTRGRIFPSPKTGNGTSLSHWRPLVILNESYIILAKQIEPILYKKLGSEQKGFDSISHYFILRAIKKYLSRRSFNPIQWNFNYSD
uniref:Reverse transcriptase domain-containing protein n=1 Tax=Lepeophtheirus salmonis TaxID=72036 RepID=A0A0K2V000_LEPSM